MRRSTCEDEHFTVRSVRVAQHARQPHDDHRVDEKDVAHVLVQAEVLQEEPWVSEKTEPVLLAGVASQGWGWGMSWGSSPGQQHQQQQQQRQLGAVTPGCTGLVLQEHRQVEEGDQRPQRGVQGHSILHLHGRTR